MRWAYEKLVFDLLIKGLNYRNIPSCLEDLKFGIGNNVQSNVEEEILGRKCEIVSSILLGEKSMLRDVGRFDTKFDSLNHRILKGEKTSLLQSILEEYPSLKSSIIELHPCIPSFVAGESKTCLILIPKVCRFNFKIESRVSFLRM